MTAVFRLFEGLLLLLFGGLMLQLAGSGDLWLFLNPKFAPLTGTTGAVLMLLGLFRPFNHGLRPGLFRTVIWTLFLLVATLAIQEAETPFSGNSAFDANVFERPEPEVVVDGLEYPRMNLLELYLRSVEENAEGARFAVQGMVVRTPELDAVGRLAIVRVVVTCCLADAVAVGFVVDDAAIEDFTTGQWVEAVGALAPLAGPVNLGKAGLMGVAATSYSDRFAIAPVRLERISPPEMPYIFQSECSGGQRPLFENGYCLSSAKVTVPVFSHP